MGELIDECSIEFAQSRNTHMVVKKPMKGNAFISSHPSSSVGHDRKNEMDCC